MTKDKRDFIALLDFDPKPEELWDFWYAEYLDARKKEMTKKKKKRSEYFKLKDEYFFLGRPYCLNCFEYCNLIYPINYKPSVWSECCGSVDYALDHWITPKEERKSNWINNLNETIETDTNEMNKAAKEIYDWLKEYGEDGDAESSWADREESNELREKIKDWLDEYEKKKT